MLPSDSVSPSGGMRTPGFDHQGMKIFLWLWAILLFPALLSANPNRALPQIAETRWSYLPASSFVRISEYFTGRENTGQRIIRRTQEERSGYYLIVRFDRSVRHLPSDAVADLQVIIPGELDARHFSFPLHPIAERGSYLYLGLTGSDWTSGERRRPLAWSLVIKAEKEETVVTNRDSFLWKFPPGEHNE
jgi:hypothetical protein